MPTFPKDGILVEAEEFDDHGGWVVDSQFELQMGSPYLLAHGNGVPVADAITNISVADEGNYNVWVRAKDWVPGHHPGRFSLIVNGIAIDTVFGANDQDWQWQSGARVHLSAGQNPLRLHDQTGFCGRCDAIFFSLNDVPPPEATEDGAHSWRKRLRGLPEMPVDQGKFDVIVVGGGVPGVAAALSAVRLGETVALVHNRPFLGGNASVEIGLRPRGTTGPLVDEIASRTDTGDIHAKQLLEAETNATAFLEYVVYNTKMSGSTITSIDARNARSGKEIRLTAPTFIDCSGTAILGLLSGAETLFGQESKAEYGEKLAPDNGDQSHHGNTLFFRTRMGVSPSSFPLVPWAKEVAKDYSDLGGQLVKPGQENGPGPQVLHDGMDQKIPRRMKGPLTHFWEYGQLLDPYKKAEEIRDYLLQAVYGTFSNVKSLEPEKYANLDLEWVACVPAQGQFRRYKGDHVLTETDIRDHTAFDDAVVRNEGAFCLHYGGHDKYDFRLKYWEWDERDGKPYDIPFRCLYSCNISNLMMAGKHMSATHVAGLNTKFMGNGAQHAMATAAAAHLCQKYQMNPRKLGRTHMTKLRQLAASITKGTHSQQNVETSKL